MATEKIRVNQNWQQVSSGENVVIQNIGDATIEIATGDNPSNGFIRKKEQIFSYTFSEPVWVRTTMNNRESVIVIDKG